MSKKYKVSCTTLGKLLDTHTVICEEFCVHCITHHTTAGVHIRLLFYAVPCALLFTLIPRTWWYPFPLLLDYSQ